MKPIRGALAGFFGRLGCAGALFFGILITLAVYALLAPWSFHIGGRWTPVFWHGVGKLRDSAGAEYGLYIGFSPYFRGSTRLLGNKAWPATGLRGQGWVCTAGGANYRFDLRGDIYGAWSDTDGEETDFSLDQRRVTKNRRRFSLYGVWHGQELVLDDHKIMFMNFRPDGTLTPAGSYTSPVPEKHANVTLAWGSYSAFESLCRSLRATSAAQSTSAR